MWSYSTNLHVLWMDSPFVNHPKFRWCHLMWLMIHPDYCHLYYANPTDVCNKYNLINRLLKYCLLRVFLKLGEHKLVQVQLLRFTKGEKNILLVVTGIVIRVVRM